MEFHIFTPLYLMDFWQLVENLGMHSWFCSGNSLMYSTAASGL